MGDVVGLKEIEYSDLESGIKKVHDDYISKIETVVAKIEKINSKAGGLYLEQLSPQITSMVSEINTLKTAINDTFEAHEKIIKSFQSTIDNYDATL